MARTVTPGGPTFSGTKESIVRSVAAEQGWSLEDLEDTVDDIDSPDGNGW